MTTGHSRYADTTKQLMLKAVAISLAIHVSAYSGWKWGKTHIHWKGLDFPAWLQLPVHKASPLPLLQLPSMAQERQPAPLLYVDVDPMRAVAKPPDNPKFYSSENTVAANPEIKVRSDKPDITGTQDKVVKTVAPAPHPVPLQPSPAPEPKTETAMTENAESKAAPKPTLAPGGLTDAKPAEKTIESKGTAAADAGTAAATEPQHERPRRLADVRDRAGVPGPKMRQQGGVNRLESDSSLDAMKTVYGDYDRDFIDAVRERWFELLSGRQDNVEGRVVLEFNLHADGRVTDMKMTFSNVNSLLALICQQAVQDPAPFKRWPAEMRREISDPREIRFTFYYE